jgi:hypothetical protein
MLISNIAKYIYTCGEKQHKILNSIEIPLFSNMNEVIYDESINCFERESLENK